MDYIGIIFVVREDYIELAKDGYFKKVELCFGCSFVGAVYRVVHSSLHSKAVPRHKKHIDEGNGVVGIVVVNRKD